MAKQTRLEKEAIDLRNETLLHNNYQDSIDNVYSANHKDAISDGDVQGKGTGVALGVAGLPGATESRAISYSNMITTHGGGQYDIEGRNGVGGRNKLKTISLYNEDRAYGRNAIDTTLNEQAGQYFVK